MLHALVRDETLLLAVDVVRLLARAEVLGQEDAGEQRQTEHRQRDAPRLPPVEHPVHHDPTRAHPPDGRQTQADQHQRFHEYLELCYPAGATNDLLANWLSNG